MLSGCYLDLLYAMGLGVLFLPVLHLSRGRISRPAASSPAYALACILSLLYALSTIQVVDMLGQPLTYSALLLRLPSVL